jgi:hypothetical protein
MKRCKPTLFQQLNCSVTMFYLKSITFWDMTPCSPLSFNRRFGGTYRLHLQGRRRYVATCFFVGLLNLFSRPWRWRRYVSPKRRLKLNGLQGVTSHKMILFITTAVKTSNPTMFYFFTKISISNLIFFIRIGSNGRRNLQLHNVKHNSEQNRETDGIVISL